MTVADLKTEQGVKALDAFFADRSYAEGFTPSQADLALFEALSKAPGAGTPHALRWYTHIKSFNQDERKKFPGIKKAPAAFGAVVVPAAAPAKAAAADDDDVDLFGSDEEEESAEAAKLREERVSAYTQKKSAKPALIAKSSIVLEVKPWDDETDMKEMEKKVRSITMEGLLWGAGKLVPVGYGIQKLQISCVVVDDLVSIDLLQEEIQNFEDFVQSVDIAAFNKI